MYKTYRLFFGNDRPINITSIKLIKSCSNLGSLIRAITILDNCISGNVNHYISEYEYGKKLSALFNYFINGKLENKWNKFVYDTFECFIKNKKRMDIDIDKVSRYVGDQDLLNLMFHSLNADSTAIMDEKDSTNLIKQSMFEIFENVEEINIQSNEHSFSLFGFLEIISETKITKVTITAGKYGFEWIESLWKDHQQKIEARFDASEFDIHMDQQEQIFGYSVVWWLKILTITKKNLKSK